MAEINGWISLHRQLQNHWVWKDANKLKFWLDILLTVNSTDQKVNIGFEVYECKRGQSVMSISNWASRWGCSKDFARHFLLLLQKDNMIALENLVKTTRITVCNYDNYQCGSHVIQSQSNRNPIAIQSQHHTNNNVNNDNNENKVFVAPSINEVISYFELNGYSEELARKAHKYYDEAGWKDSKGKKVQRWKQKMIGVWFNDENKVEVKSPISTDYVNASGREPKPLFQ